MFQFAGGIGQLALDQAHQVCLDLGQALLPFKLVGAQQFSCSGGGGGAVVRNHVRYAEINLVSYRADNGQLAGGNRTGHNFLVEGPQILQ